MVGDYWTSLRAYCASVGSPRWGYIEPTPDKIGEHIGRLMRLDMPSTEFVRGRADEIVKDPAVAEKLKGWYPSWCKRPTFHDGYLELFNKEHVHLVDTEGHGVEGANERGLVVAGTEYPLDILILSTGFEGPASGHGNPAFRAGYELIGKGGRSLHAKWKEQGATTLHAASSNGFPNCFWQSPIQGSSGANYTYSIETWTDHLVAVLIDMASRVGDGQRPIVENTVEAEETWAGEILRHGAYLAGFMPCTPGYITSEGALAVLPTDQAELMKKARLGTWSLGLETFTEVLKKAREEGNKGYQVTPVAA